MKAISLWQPWASLLFSPGDERKEFETRPRSMGFKRGETIAIHAAKTLDGFRAYPQIPFNDRFLIEKSLLSQFTLPKIGTPWQCVLPMGAIIGTLEIGDVLPVEQIRDVITERERAFGDYRSGRVAIETLNPVKFEKPIEWKGQQGVFFVPDRVLSGNEC